MPASPGSRLWKKWVSDGNRISEIAAKKDSQRVKTVLSPCRC